MKQFIRKVLIFALVLFVVDKAFYFFIQLSPSLEVDKRLEMLIEGQMEKDLIVFGSSRGARNIIASQIEDSLHISSYNLSYPGSNIEFHEFLLRLLLKHNSKPKIILLSIDQPVHFLPNEELIFRLDRLYPLIKYNDVNNEMIRRGEKNVLSKFMILARMNKKNFDIRKRQFTALDTIQNCGSMPISFQRKDIDFESIKKFEHYDTSKELPAKLLAFENFQKICIENEIKLIVFFSPNYFERDLIFENRIESLCLSETKIYHYDSLNVAYQDKSYYYDFGHLKRNGAIIFTNEVIALLSESN